MAGIYLHIPFCKTICSYCDFYSITDNSRRSELVQSLIMEASLRRSYLSGESVETIYFGGGTPSLLDPSVINEILTALRTLFSVTADAEVTLEANPDDIYSGRVRDLRQAGVNRLSIGIQSWDDARLRYLGRRHDAAQSARAIDLAVTEGIGNISVDLIYGVPGMTLTDLRRDLQKTFEYPVKHLSAYHLTIEPHTPFGRMKEKGKLKETDEETSVAMFSLLGKLCRENGLIQYEISNFAREGFISRHNSSYWKQVPYLGLGPSAHSFDRQSRQWNSADINGYIDGVSRGEVPFEREELDKITMFNEYVMTALRTMWGIDLLHVEEFYDKELHDYLVNLSDRFIKYGMIRREKNTLILTDQGKMISDNIIAELLSDL